MRTLCVAFAFVFALLGTAVAQLAPTSTDARAIMSAAHRADAGDRARARLSMTLTDASGGSRTRTLVSRQLRFSGGRRSMLVFESPADVRGTGLLTVDYTDGTRADDQWIYLPSVRRSTRIASDGRAGSFAGSDFAYADFTVADPALYDVRLVTQEEVVEGEPCWVIEATPREARTRTETGYTKVQLWIGKRTLLALRMKGFMTGGRTKFVVQQNVRVVSGIPTAHRVVARTVVNGRVASQTVIERTDVAYGDASIVEADFSTQRLERGL